MNLLDLFSRKPRGLFELNVYSGGRLIERVVEKNLIVDNSKQVHAHLLGGDVTNRSVTQFGVGTSGAAPVGGNTGLASQYLKAIDGVSYPATNQVRFAFSLGTGEYNGQAILEFGLFTGANVLFARKVRAVALNKASDISFSGGWTITYP